MKLKHVLPTILSLSTLSIMPMSLCSCANDFVKNNENILNDETSTIKFNTTVGHGHTIYDEEEQEIELGKDITVDSSKDFRCTFVSTEYGNEGEPKMPVHRQLKTKDVEVVQNNKNIINKCSLINNVLTIPFTVLQSSNPIQINLLGAEIADWITWDNIQEMSQADDEHTDHKYDVTNWFEVGDYKMLYEQKKAQSYGYATIIDMEKRDYIYKEGSREKTAPSPFTFEVLEPHDSQKFDKEGGDSEDSTYSWEESGCTLWEKAYQYGEDQRFGFTPRLVECNSDDKYNNHSYFYVLSLAEMGLERDIKANFYYEYKIEESWSVNAFYAYYNKTRYYSIKTLSQRVNRSSTRWTRDFIPYDYPIHDHNWILKSDSPTKICAFPFQCHDKYSASWAFCL